MEHDYGLLVSEDQYESDHAHANALQRLRCDLVTLNKLFARRDSLTHPDAEPHRTVTTTSQGQNCYTYHVERPFSAEEAFILADALAHSRLADSQEKEQLLEKVKSLHYREDHRPIAPCITYRPRPEASAALLANYRAVARAVDRLNEMGNRRGGKLAPISLIYGTLGPDFDLVAQPRQGCLLERELLHIAVHEDRGRYYMSSRFIDLEETPEGPATWCTMMAI